MNKKIFYSFKWLFIIPILFWNLGIHEMGQTKHHIIPADTLTIIHVNDTHSNLLPYASGQRGGLARAATVISSWKAREPNPILLHCGDFMVGTLMFNRYFGVPELQLLDQLGFDALLLGNHEFDVGSQQLGEILSSAGLSAHFHILCSNARNLSAVPQLASRVTPHIIIQRRNLKIGLFGLTTPATNVESRPAPVFLDTALVAVAQREIEALHRQGAQVVIMLSHLGLPLDRQLAADLNGVDAIIGGHTHSVLQQPVMVNDIPIVQAGEFYHYVGKLRLVFDGTSTRLLDYTLKEIDASVPELPAVARAIAELKQGVVDAFTPVLGNPYQPLAENDTLLSHIPELPEKPTTDVGRLVTAAMRWFRPAADYALEPTGHIVEDLYPGEITAADLFRVYPYGYDSSDHLGFRIVTFQLSGRQISGILSELTRYIDPKNQRFDYLMQSDGLHFTLKKEDEKLSLNTVTIGNQSLQPDSIYTIVSSSQTAEYLPALFHIQPANLTTYSVSVVQVVTEFVKHHETSFKRIQQTNTFNQSH